MSIKYWLPLVALLWLPTPARASHSGSAPIEPSKQDDEHFVVDTDTGLDTSCTFRNGSPLTFKVKINRYVGEIQPDGFLKEPGKLIASKVISPKAQLVMPAFDVDFDSGEIDKVFFNGHQLSKPLTGTDGTWIENQFEVPIEWVKFPARGSNGANGSEPSLPTPAENEIQIDIDTTNAGWCTAIDWAELRFKAMAPLLLIHGIGANPVDAWEVEPGVTNYLRSLGIPFEHRIRIGPNNRIFPQDNAPGNAQALEGEIRANAQSFGVQKVHLVGHSKGGLDSRGYLSNFYHPEEVRVLSLHTLTTPHQGSVLADISIQARTLIPRPVGQAGDNEMQTFIDTDFWLENLGSLIGKGPQLPGLANLQTEFMNDFNSIHPFPVSGPHAVKLYTYGADADLPPKDNIITLAEAHPFLPHLPPFINAAEQGTVVYHLLRNVSTTNLIQIPLPTPAPFPFPFPTFNFENVLERISTTNQYNDLAVTDTSSQHPSQLQHFSPSPSNPWLYRNHRNVKHPDTMDRVLDKIRTDFSVN